MEFTDVIEWLDKQVTWRNEGIALKKLDSQIEAIDIRYDDFKEIHIWNFDVIADILGIEPQIEHYVEGYDQLYFMYKGYKVFGLREKIYVR